MRLVPLAYLWTASATCIASSRVGTSTSAARLAAARLASRRQAIEQRQRERGGLARAGRGLAEQVAAGEQHRNGLALNRCGFFVAERGDGADQRFRQTERGEAARFRWERRSSSTHLTGAIYSLRRATMRVDGSGAAGGKIAGHRGDQRQKYRDPGETDRIGGGDVIEERLNHAGDAEGAQQAQHHTDRRQRQPLPNDEATHVRALRAERNAHAHLLRALGH